MEASIIRKFSKDFILKRFDRPALSFRFRDDGWGEVPVLDEVYNYSILPVSLPLHKDDGADAASRKLEVWLTERFLPPHRWYAARFLDIFKIRRGDLRPLIEISLGLSVNDCFWIVPEDFERRFDDYTLYNRSFSDEGVLSVLISPGPALNAPSRRKPYLSPEFTTHGMMPKFWRRGSDTLSLYKSGLPAESGMGREPHSEYFASQLADYLGIAHVRYELDMFRDVLCSVCRLFTGTKVSFVPLSGLIPQDSSEDMSEIVRFVSSLPERFKTQLSDMLLFDALICNTDRHFGNFGLLLDSETDSPISFAPLYDHGLSLLHRTPEYKLSNSSFEEFDGIPACYPDFFTLAAETAGDRQIKMLKKALEFEFTQHPSYRVSDRRIRFLSAWVMRRARKLLELILRRS